MRYATQSPNNLYSYTLGAVRVLMTGMVRVTCVVDVVSTIVKMELHLSVTRLMLVMNVLKTIHLGSNYHVNHDLSNNLKEQGMLILTRNHSETISIGDDVLVTVLDVKDDQVRLGITVPQGALLVRNKSTAQLQSSTALEARVKSS